MQLTVLVDNNTFIDQYYVGEPAVCYYIEDGESKILLDVGYSDVFMYNAKKMGINIRTVTDIVISHGHDDHTRGLKYLCNDDACTGVRLVAHPDVFAERYENSLSIGCPVPMAIVEKSFNVTLTKKPLRISDSIVFLGEIPSYNNFERKNNIGFIKKSDELEKDFVFDDSAIAYRGPDGLFIITGCSHSGICNIVEHAKNVCQDDRIAGILGGFHLLEVSDQLYRTITYFKENNIKNLFPCHCVSLAAKCEINNHINISEVGVGLKIRM